MVRIRALIRSNISHPDQQRRIGTAHPKLVAVKRKVRISPFRRHFLEMFADKWADMVAAAPVVLLTTHGLSSTSQALRLYPWPSVLSMGLSMAVPMVAWMLVRGHGWRNSAEMAAAMVVPAIPFVCLAGLHVISGTACRAYMPLSIVAMIGLMVYRRAAYSMPMSAPWRRRPQP
jgi:hypothetical protein